MIVNQDIIPAAGVLADAVVFFTLRVRDQPAVQAGGVEQGGVVAKGRSVNYDLSIESTLYEY